MTTTLSGPTLFSRRMRIPEDPDLKLRYPNARLQLYERLLTKQSSCHDALIQSIEDCGLTPVNGARPVVSKLSNGGSSASCHALDAAKAIMRDFLVQKYTEEDAERLIERSCSSLERDLKIVLKDRQIHEGCARALMNGNADTSGTECKSIAPVLLDILLQHIDRH